MLPTTYDLAFPLAHCQCIGFHVFGDRGAGGNRSAVVYSEGGDEFSIGADKDIVADDRFMFINPVVVTGDRPGADVDPFADLGVTDIAEVVGFSCPGRISAFLISTKLPICTSWSSLEPGRILAKGPILLFLPMRALSMTQLAKIVAPHRYAYLG